MAQETDLTAATEPHRHTGLRAYAKLARPTQWSKSVFVLVGPAYGWSQGQEIAWMGVAWAVVVFSLASSGLYVINDWFDRDRDRAHPRKRHRPLASGAVSPMAGLVFAGILLALSGVAVAMIPPGVSRVAVGVLVLLHMANVLVYSAYFKRKVIVDVLSLSLGFVFRVVAGCAAAGIEPSTWLLNATLFLSMFLAFGKRLGERRTLGADASAARSVQDGYSDALLQMAVVVTAVAALLTYAGYVQSRAAQYTVFWGENPPLSVVGEFGEPAFGLNLLWLTMLPAMLAMLRAMVQLERGAFDDPTEMALRDAVVRVCAVIFFGLTVLAVALSGGSLSAG